MDQAPKMEEYFDLSMYGSTETGEDPDDENDYYYTRERYWYHPNYLGNVDMITNDNGHIHQYFVYSPFGENMYQYNRNSDFNSRYKFNGKELDEETGNGYYGARYYNPKISVWLSVDPLAHKYPNFSPFVFVANNPIMLVDPDGRQLWKPEVLEDKTVKYVPEEGDNEKTLASQYGLTSAEAKELVKNGAEDGSISGAVAKKVTGSSILQLDVRDASVTSDDINRQAAFAINYENALDIEMVGDFEGDLDDYFSYRSFSDGSSSGLNTSKSNPTSVEIGGE